MRLIVPLVISLFFSSGMNCKEGGVFTPGNSKDNLVLGDTLEVAYQDTLFGTDENVWLTFDSLLEESRCPVNVTCVWAGNAKISLTFFASENKSRFELNTHPMFTQDTTILAHKIALIEVTPYPHTDSLYIPQDYATKITIRK